MTQDFENLYNDREYLAFIAAGEKRYIRRAGNIIGVIGLIIAALSQFWFRGVLVVTDLMGISREAVQGVVVNEGFIQFVQVLYSTVCFALLFLIALKTMNISAASAIPFNKIKKGTFWPYLFIGVAFCAFANLAVDYAGAIFENLGFKYNLSESQLPGGAVGFLIFAIATAVVPAMVEEFGCRGVLIGVLHPMGDGFAVITSAVVFGVLHGNFTQIPFAFLVGLVLGYIRIKSGSLLVCILVHFINNFVSVVLSYLRNSVSIYTLNICYVIFLAVCLALGFIGIKKLNEKEKAEIKPAKTLSPERDKLKWFLTSPWMVVFIVIELVSSLRYFFV